MGKAYLLTGEPKVGKTTALKIIIQTIGVERCGGFFTEEVQVEGTRVGFRIVTIDGQTKIFADVNSKSPIRLGKYGININNLKSLAIHAMYQAIADKEFVIVDEIGPMQLFSDEFKRAVLDVISSPKQLLGTIVLRSYSWADEFKQRKDVEIYHLTLDNRNNMIKTLCWLFGKELKISR